MELDRIVAVVDDDVVMQSELEDQLNRVREQLRKQGTSLPPTAVLRHQVMERLILQKIQLQVAGRTDIVVDDEGLDQTILDIAKQNNLTLSQFREILKSDGYAFEDFRQNIREEITIARLRKREVDNRVRVTQQEIDNYLSNEANEGPNEKELRISHILIAIPTGATDDEEQAAREQATAVYERLQAGEEFGDVAISTSDGQQALERGDLGWRKASQLPTLFADTVMSMKVGDTSGIITSPSGYHLIKLMDERSSEKIMVEQTHCRHILITPNELISDEEAVVRLRQLKLRLEGGADFAELARTNSDDRGSALQGGDLGWVSTGEMVHEFEEVLSFTRVGEISKPFKTNFGWHILQVIGKRSHDGTDEVRRQKAQAAIRQRKTDERLQSWLRRLRDEAYVELRTDIE